MPNKSDVRIDARGFEWTRLSNSEDRLNECSECEGRAKWSCNQNGVELCGRCLKNRDKDQEEKGLPCGNMKEFDKVMNSGREALDNVANALDGQKIDLPSSAYTPGPWTVQEGKTLLHVETANLGDGKRCGMPVCSIPKKRMADAVLIAAAPQLVDRLLTRSVDSHFNNKHLGSYHDCDSFVCSSDKELLKSAGVEI